MRRNSARIILRVAGGVRGDDVHRQGLEQWSQLASAARDVEEGRARRVDFAQQLGDRRFLAGRDDPGPDVLRPEPVRVLGLVPSHVLPAAISTEGLAGPLLLAIGVPGVIGGLHGKTPPAETTTAEP